MPSAERNRGARAGRAVRDGLRSPGIVPQLFVTVALASLATLSACAPTPPPAARSPTASAGTASPAATVAAEPLAAPETTVPTPTASATPAPAVDPDSVAELAEAGQAALASRDIDPICLRWEDTDGDGDAEWVGLVLRPGDPPRLEGFILDGEAWHRLAAPPGDDDGLGTYAACELEIRDVNVDGRTELLIPGRSTEDIDLLHIFVWRETGYAMLASFSGDAGIDVRDINGDLAEEIVARWDAGSGLAWEQIHTWDGSHYGWTWERYTWLYADHPHAYATDDPEHALISFYLALGDRDLPAAYDLLTSEGEPARSYDAWAGGFDTMLAVEVGSVHEMQRSDDRATVSAQVRSYDNFDGYIIGRLWDVTWTLVREQDVWLLDHDTSEVLERWEAVYFP